MTGERQAPVPATVPFGSSLHRSDESLRPSIFGLLALTTLIESSHVLTMPLTLAPVRLMLADAPYSLAISGTTLSGAGYLCRRVALISRRMYLCALPGYC